MRTLILSSIFFLFQLETPVLLAQEPLEFTSPIKKAQTATPQEKAFYQRVLEAMNTIGNGKNADSSNKAISKLNNLLKEHPSYSDGYLLRALAMFYLRPNTDYQQIIQDINKSINLRSSSQYKSAYENVAQHYSIKAKAEKLSGKLPAALDDLERAIRLSPSSPNDVISVSGTKAEESSHSDLWTKADFDEFISSFPNDARAHLFRGYFYSFFTTFNEDYYSAAVSDYENAIALDSSSALSYFLLGEVYEKSSFWKKEVWSDLSGQVKDSYHRKVVEQLTKSIQCDPQFKEAYVSRANALYSLQEYDLAIADYDKIIELAPSAASAYNDRGLAKFNLGHYWAAISDLDRAVQLKQTNGDLESSYKNRADAYFKSGNYSEAIQDYGRAIQANLSKVIILMNVQQIRAIYPEYKQLSDATLIKKLWDKLGSNLEYKDFAEMLSKNRNFSSTITPDLYVARGDAYLNNYQFKNAIREYQRALDGFPDYADAIDRWRLFYSSTKSQYYLDIKNVELRSDQAEFWSKEVFNETKSHNTAYSLRHWTLLCSSRITKLNESIDYDSNGNVVNSWSGADWQKIVPDTFGEILFKGWCGSRR